MTHSVKTMALLIREYREDDASVVRRCVVELQDFERTIDPRLRTGESMADKYLETISARCSEAHGQVFVAEQNGTVVGFVAALAAQAFTEPDEPPGTYGLVTDLVVLPSYRGHRIGQRLLERAESFVRAAGAPELRIGVLAENVVARRLYLASGFVPHAEVFIKRW